MSRIERILKAIINNTEYTDPRMSRVEEILYSFLVNIEYLKDPESRVEALLLALKEMGIYTDATLSRVEKILKSKLDETEYTAPPESRIEELLLEWDIVTTEIVEEDFTNFPHLFNAIEGDLLDMKLWGNMSQTGTPSPQSIIMPQECGERTGNLFDYSTITTGYRIIWATGVLYADSTGILSDYINVDIGEEYIYSKSAGYSNAYFIGYDQNKEYLGVYNSVYGFIKASSNRYNRITIPSDSDCAYIRLMTFSTDPIDSTSILNSGSAPLPYEPYGYKLDISSGDTTTPIYLGEVETTRQIRKLVLTGEETYVIYTYSNTSGIQVQNMLDTAYKRANGICNIYPVATTSGTTHCLWIGSGGSDRNLYFVSILDDMGLQDAAAFKTWVTQQYNNGTPVTVWYVLATPTTGIVNEPLRKIGDYADSITIPEGVNIPTVEGSNVLDVLTTLKPSKGYIKYERNKT